MWFFWTKEGEIAASGNASQRPRNQRDGASIDCRRHLILLADASTISAQWRDKISLFNKDFVTIHYDACIKTDMDSVFLKHALVNMIQVLRWPSASKGIEQRVAI